LRKSADRAVGWRRDRRNIIFKNQDDLPHSVVIPDLKVKSPLMDTDGSYEADFEKPGEFKYFCGIHPMMTGKIIVKPD
jgi:plastocyanin